MNFSTEIQIFCKFCWVIGTQPISVLKLFLLYLQIKLQHHKIEPWNVCTITKPLCYRSLFVTTTAQHHNERNGRQKEVSWVQIPGFAFLCKYCHLTKKVAPYTPCLNHLDKNRFWILGLSLPGVILYSEKIWSRWLHFCWIVQFGHCLWCLLVGFCVFKFAFNPLRTSLTRETDWKITTAKSLAIVHFHKLYFLSSQPVYLELWITNGQYG